MAKKMGLPLASTGLIYVKNKAISFFDWLGTVAGHYLNVYEWVKKLETFFQNIWRFIKDAVQKIKDFVERVWRFIVDHIWDNIRPFIESVVEIVQPAWQLMFSWSYFFVGFAKTHYVVFSYVGGGLIVTGVSYFIGCQTIIEFVTWRYLITALVATGVGVLIAFPDILPQMFPNAKKNMEAINRAMDEEHVIVNGFRHNTRDLRTWTLIQLTELLEDAGLDAVGLPRRKEAYIRRLTQN
jgi:hypothetical protein